MREAVSDNGVGFGERGKRVQVASWESPKHNMGMAFNRRAFYYRLSIVYLVLALHYLKSTFPRVLGEDTRMWGCFLFP